MPKRQKRKSPRHKFLFQYPDAAGRMHKIEAWAKVKVPSRAVQLMVTAAHVQRSMKLNGVGDTTKCSMAVCTSDNEAAFPHNVEGHVDWSYTRCWVVSKVDKRGMPVECYVYEHNDDVARLNDSKNGQAKLLRQLQEEGPRYITLSPKRIRSKKGRKGSHRPKRGTRDTEARIHARGGKLRYAMAQMASEQPEAV